MIPETIDQLAKKLADSPILRASSLPDMAAINAASQEIGVPFPPEYREFLLTFGGAIVGPFPIFGLRPVEAMGSEWSVVAVTQRYRDDGVPGCEAWIVFSEDHAGNPVGMDSSGAVWIHDHDFGGIARLAQSFEEYIRVQCLKLPATL
jgi:hypothetical protein